MPSETASVLIYCLVAAIALNVVLYAILRYVYAGDAPIFVHRHAGEVDVPRAALVGRNLPAPELRGETNHLMESRHDAAE
jgi:hypothetical protein